MSISSDLASIEEAFGGSRRPRSLASFVTAVDAASGTIEDWVACTVVERRTVYGEERLTIAGAGQSPGSGEIECSFPDVVLYRLQARHRAEVAWDELVGSTLSLRLKSAAGAVIQLEDVAPDWVEDQIRATARACLRELAEAGELGLQQALQEPERTDGVCLVRAEDDAAGLVAEARLKDLGLTVRVEVADFDGGRGRISLVGALKRAQAHGEEGKVDLVLLVHAGTLRDGIFALQSDHAASIINGMGIPVVVGAERPSSGSLVHQLAFAAYDDVAAAVEAVRGLVRRGREARAKEAIIDAWNVRLKERSAAAATARR